MELYRAEFDTALNELRKLYLGSHDTARIYLKKLEVEGMITSMFEHDVPVDKIWECSEEYRGVVGEPWP